MTDLTQLLDRVSALLGRRDLTQQEVQAWWNGTAEGGPNGDGLYPFTDSTGFVRLLPSPARVALTGGALVASLIDPAAPDTSLAHRARLEVGQRFLVAAHSPGTRAAMAVWRCIEVRPIVRPAAPAIVAIGSEIVLEGMHGRYALELGGEQDVYALGTPTPATLTMLRDAALARGARLTGASGDAGVTMPAGVDMGRARLDWADLKLLEPAAGLDNVMLELQGGSIGGVHHSRTWVEGRTRVPNPGIGEFTFQNPSKAVGVVLGPDGQGSSARHFEVHRLKVGVKIAGNVEKHNGLRVTGTANGILLQEIEDVALGGSPDSNAIEIGGAYNGVVLATAFNTSGRYAITHEGRIDQGLFLTDPAHPLYVASLAAMGQAVPEPGVLVQSGKYHWIYFNEWRGMNGRVALFCHKDGNDGADTFRLDGSGVHNYGIFAWINAVQRLVGAPVCNDQQDGRSNYATSVNDWPAPAFLLGRIYDASGFLPVINRCANVAGYQLGNPDPVLADGSVGLFPTRTSFCLAGTMAQIVDGVSLGPNPRTGFYPKGKVLIDVARADGCEITVPAGHGDIRLRAGAQDCSISIPAYMVDNGCEVVDEAGASGNRVQIRGRTRFSHIANKAWLEGFDQLLGLEALAERGDLPATYTAGRWEAAQQLRASAAELGRLSSDLNWRFKKAGVLVLNTDTGTLWRATGSAATSAWAEVGGAGSIVPAANAGLAALLARMTAPPAAGTHWHFVYDRILTELAAIWPAGSLARFHLLGAHDRQAARLDWQAVGRDLTEQGTLTFAAGRGFTGDGASGYLASAHVPGSTGETNADVWVHAHVLALGGTTNGDTVGSDTKSVRLRAAFGANNRAEIGTTAIHSMVAVKAAPRSIAALIAEAGVMKQWDNGELRGTKTFAPAFSAPLPASIDILRGYDPTGARYRYGDETVSLVAYGRGATDARMIAMAQLSQDASFWARPA